MADTLWVSPRKAMQRVFWHLLELNCLFCLWIFFKWVYVYMLHVDELLWFMSACKVYTVRLPQTTGLHTKTRISSKLYQSQCHLQCHLQQFPSARPPSAQRPPPRPPQRPPRPVSKLKCLTSFLLDCNAFFNAKIQRFQRLSYVEKT